MSDKPKSDNDPENPDYPFVDQDYIDEFPPDCEDGNCKKCHACYSEYVSLKMAGQLD